MSKSQRILIFVISMALLAVIFTFWQKNNQQVSSVDTVILTSLVMISFITLFLEHWFTRPTDVLAASISILLVMAPLRYDLDKFGTWYEIFFGYNLLMALAALSALLLLNSDRSMDIWSNRVSLRLKKFATTFGNGRALYFGLFILTMLFYVDTQSSPFIILFGYSALILLVDPKRFILNLAVDHKSRSPDIGEIFGVQSKNTFLVKLYDEREEVQRFDFVEFRHSMGEPQTVQKGLIIDNYLLNQEQWVKVLASPDIAPFIGEDPVHDNHRANVVYKIAPHGSERFVDRFVGVVVEGSTILTLRFEYAAKVSVHEGTLLEVPIGQISVLYQIVQGTTDVEPLESKNETGVIIGQAVQLGTWNGETRSFDRFGWVPEVNSPVYTASPVAPAEVSPGELLIGHIPDTNFPILLNKNDAISHHIAILGVTGSGKSVFARDLIRRFAQDGTKFVCVDFTNEYGQSFADLGARPIVTGEVAEEMFASINALSLETAKFQNQQDQRIINHHEGVLEARFRAAIVEFLQSDEMVVIFELPDVSNSTGILEYTRWFFKTMFLVAKEENNFGQQVCVVLEEAHTVVPEWNFIGADSKGAQALVNSIGQIALQGRKYNIGFMVIAQRTANVSKTVLTQCNSIVSFQQFDKTSADFLTNYMGTNMVEALPMLKPRQAIATGKAFKSGMPSIFQVPDIEEPGMVAEDAE